MSDHHHHHHDHSGPLAIGATAAKVVIGLLTGIGVIAVVAAVLLWPSHQHIDIPVPMQNGGGGAVQTQAGTVTMQDIGPCGSPSNGKVFDDTPQPPPNDTYSCGRSLVSITSGPDRGKHTLLEIPPGPDQPKLKIGDKIRISRQNDPSGVPNYAFEDYSRGLPLTLIAILFVVVIVAVARWRGLRAVIGLGLAFAVLIEFMLPALLDGKPALPVAVVAGTLILYAVLYLAHGVNLRTSSALLGTLSAMLLATVLSWVALRITHVTGLSQEDNTNVATYVQHVSITGLLLAGFIIGSLGVLNDVTITQASTAFELAAIDERSTRREIFLAAMRVGKDHIASTVYTLVLAYAGGALPLLLLFSVAGRSLSDVITGDAVAIEIVRSAVGGICLALSVPLTTVIAVLLARPFSLRSEPEPEPAPRRARRTKETAGESHSHRGADGRTRRRAAEHRHTPDDAAEPDEDEGYLRSLSQEPYQPGRPGRRRADPDAPGRRTPERAPGRPAERPADTGAQSVAPRRRLGPPADTQANRLPAEPDSYRQAPPRRHSEDPYAEPRSAQSPPSRHAADPYATTTGGWPTTSGRHSTANHPDRAADPDYDEPTRRQRRRADQPRYADEPDNRTDTAGRRYRRDWPTADYDE